MMEYVIRKFVVLTVLVFVSTLLSTNDPAGGFLGGDWFLGGDNEKFEDDEFSLEDDFSLGGVWG